MNFSKPGYVKTPAAVGKMGNMGVMTGFGKGKSAPPAPPQQQFRAQPKTQPKSQPKSQTKPQGKSHKNLITFVNGKRIVV